MDPLTRASTGINGIEAPQNLKDQALKQLRHWLTDPDFEAYRPQLNWLIEQGQWPALLDRFYQILPFGTGGRRGAVGIGPNRMNRWTLGASVQGHAEYLEQRFPGKELHVGLAYDVRQFEDNRKQYNPTLPNPALHLSSRDLAQHAAGVYAANGIHAHILPSESKHYLATPELSFTIRQLQCHGGLNISASHNPPDDNGGKFYDERGGQPVPPDDQLMADLVDRVTQIKYLPWPEAVRSGRVHFLDDGPHQAYIDLCKKQSLIPPPKKDEDFKVVFTPLHGVGSMTALEVLVEQGFRVVPVAEQMTADGQFPNVTKTPNPEIPVAMDRAAALGKAQHADIALSTDPDADRLGAMIPVSRGQGSGVRGQEEWRFVTGNEIAALLTHFKLSKLKEQGRLPSSPIVVRTEVTTSQVTRIARKFDAQVVDNLLVGFKYIADVLWMLESEGAYEDVRGTPADFVIASEESHGILVTQAIRDKDAGAAALLLAELALDQKRKGQTVLDYLERLYREFGYYRHDGVPVFMAGLQGRQQMVQMLDKLRVHPPTTIAGLPVTRFEDLRDETGRLGPLKGATDAASRNFLLFQCGEHARLAVRPSGTEPKAKIYVEVSCPPCPANVSAEQWADSCKKVDQLLADVSADFVRQALNLIGLDPSAAGVP